METVARGIRIPKEILEKIKNKAEKKGLTFNQVVNLAIQEMFRPHKKTTN